MDVASLVPLLDIGQSINIQRSDGEETYAIGSTTYRCPAAHSGNSSRTILYACISNAGRVHEAAITSVDEERRFVSVEWFENGETKGKEVSIFT